MMAAGAHSAVALALAAAGLVSWLYLAFGRHNFWRADQVLDGEIREPRDWPSVVAVIPARNEAELIAASLASVAGQDYPGAFHVVLVDDSSDDGTADIARRLAAEQRPGLIDVIAAPPLEEGWTGKLWALSHGIAHARAAVAGHDFIWLTDADIVHGPGVLSRLAAKAIADRRDLVSLMVCLKAEGVFGLLLVPAFIFFFQMLYPFADVNRWGGKTAAAAGGCILIRRRVLEAFGGIGAMRGALIDDCSLAAMVKAAGGRLWLGLADNSRGLRSSTLADHWETVVRTAYTQLNHSPLMLAGTIAGMLVTYLAPPLLVVLYPLHGSAPALLAALLSSAVLLRLYIPTLARYGRPAWEGALLPLVAFLYLLMTLHSAIAHWRGGGGRWKARTYSQK